MESGTGPNDQVRVSLRYVGDDVDPTMITSMMGLQPSKAHAKGDPVEGHPDRVRSTGLWGLDSTLPPSCPLESHLKHLLDMMESRISIIEELRTKGLSINFFCGYFAVETLRGSYVRLETHTLERMAVTGASLDLHIYCVETDGETSSSHATDRDPIC